MSFQLIQSDHLQHLDKIIGNFANRSNLLSLTSDLSLLIEWIRRDIPPKKRNSYGQYSVINELGRKSYELIASRHIPVFDISVRIFDHLDIEYLVRGMALQMICIHGLEHLNDAWPFVKRAAASDQWVMREFSVGFVRKLIGKHPEEMKARFFKILDTQDKYLRRFVSESLRPVRENRWFHNNPKWPFEILEKMFNESDSYARTSVGNNLSDWARKNSKMVYGIVESLIRSNDKNSYWIAYRACRNLVKKEPLRVMDLPKVDEYRYKKRVHYRKDYF